MKKSQILIPTIALFAFSFLTLSFNNLNNRKPVLAAINIEFPEEVQKVLENKCMNCHNSKAKNFKSKSKLNFDKIKSGEYSTSKLSKKLDKIVSQLEKNKMPPEKFLAKHPDKKITKEESELLKNWAAQQKESLSSE